MCSQAKKGTKKQLNVGKTGATAGLDDYIYEDAGQGDDFGERCLLLGFELDCLRLFFAA